MNKKAVVLLSGGLDSVTVLATAKAQGYTCYALSFDYGQRHNAELQAAAKIAADYEVELKVIRLDLGSIGGSALTDSNIDVQLIPNIWHLFKDGNLDGYFAAIASAVDDAYLNGANVVALAQASMANATQRVRHGPLPLTSPMCGLRAAIQPQRNKANE